MKVHQFSIDFVRLRPLAFTLSGLLILVAIVSLGWRGLNLGLDFTGGTLLEVGFSTPVALDEVRGTLSEVGFPRAAVVHYGSESEVLIRLSGAESPATVQRIVTALAASEPGGVNLRRSELAGPQMGDEMAGQALLAVMASFLMIMIYVSTRFQWKLSVGAVVALMHDVTITVGAFALFGWEVDLTVLAAVLALIGYSINDTIVVYDRIRENVRKMRRADMATLANTSINQTLDRTIITSMTTLLAVLAVLIFGGETLRGFATALTIGIVIGTYSSIFIATGFALSMGVQRKDLLQTAPEQGEAQETP